MILCPRKCKRKVATTYLAIPSGHGCISDASLRRLIERLRDISKRADLQISETSPGRLVKDVFSETSLRLITDMNLDTPPHPKFLETNLQNAARVIFQITTNQLITPMLSASCPTAGSGSVKKMDESSSARFFLGPFHGNPS